MAVIQTNRFGFSNALEFDGVNDYCINTSATLKNDLNVGTGDFTWECWFMRDNFTGGLMALMSTQQAGFDGGFAVFAGSGEITITNLDSSGLGNRNTYKSSTFFTASAWAHVVVIKRGNNFEVWGNGVQQSLNTLNVGTQPPVVENASDFRLGNREYKGGREHLLGKIDNVIVQTKAISQDEIEFRYGNGNGFGPRDKQNLVLWYTFDESSGTTLPDRSGNGCNGTLLNFANPATAWQKH
jgi:hypothetical protein